MIRLGDIGTELYLGELGNGPLPGTGGEEWTARTAAEASGWWSVLRISSIDGFSVFPCWFDWCGQ